MSKCPESNILCIVQARVGSARLPGKVMMDLLPGLPLIDNVINRLKSSVKISRIVLATTSQPEDDVLVAKANSLGVESIRGARDNVLSRFANALAVYDPDFVVRVCADRPFVSSALIDQAISMLQNEGYDYVNNWSPRRSWPIGLDTEVFTAQALSIARRYARSVYNLEHVTPYIWRRPKIFSLGSMIADQDDSDIRLTIDEMADLEMVRLFLKKYPDACEWEFPEIISVLRSHTELLAINSFIKQQ